MTAKDDEAAATRLLTDYYRAFSTLEVQSVLPYFHEPTVLIGPQGVFAAPTSAALAGAFGPVMEGLRAKQFDRSELSVQRVESLSATAVLVTGVALGYKVGGQE